jgi:carotenoid 1,2-hydratase
MTERGSRRLERDASSLRIGPSRLERRGDVLAIAIDEIAAPWPSRVRGTVRVTTRTWHDEVHRLDAAGRHEWQPIAPCARIEVELEQPASRWQGFAYVDSNRGSAPLEHDFARWHWSRAHDTSGKTTVLYDAQRRDGSTLGLALGFTPDDAIAGLASAPAECALPRSAWGIARSTRSDAGAPASVSKTLEDGPFYARSLVRSRIDGRATTAVHESLDLDRFASPWVQAMLPFRMPRRG